MRYQDWDVLLFPAGEGVEGAHTPFKEFRTQAQVEHKNTPNGPQADVSPLMTCFVPSVAPGTSFQISVHSWVATAPVWLPGPNGEHVRELWEVKVFVDGVVHTIAHLDVDTQWPSIITQANHEGDKVLEQERALRFPAFHVEVMRERGWQASDAMGRIRVELSAGIQDEQRGGFLKLADIATFAYQHAPLKMLEAAGIAWPSEEMYIRPIPRPTLLYHNPPEAAPAAPQTAPAHPVHHPHNPYTAHRKMPSLAQAPVHAGPQQLAAPPNPYQNYNNAFDPNSRSTSAYSTVSASAGPILPNNDVFPNTPQQQNGAHAKSPRDKQFSFRLPSDQLAQIIYALNPNRAEPTEPAAVQNAAQSMPPPPIPVHASQFRPATLPNGIGEYVPVTRVQRTEIDQHAINAFDRRAASNSGYSDVSMHPNCGDFPNCISEDPDGCIHHNGTAAPAGAVKGRKEGSSPTKPRDFLSVALDARAASGSQRAAPPPPVPSLTMAPRDMMMQTSPAREGPALSAAGLVSSSPADATGRKRTRSALKALNINDGSPEKTAGAHRPVRKASKASVSSVKSAANEKEKVPDQNLLERRDGMENQENMGLDA